MAKRGAAKTEEPTSEVESLYFKSDSAYLCLVLNRRTQFIRVIDFRAGALPSKRLYIQSVAKREGVRKVITLVEKDEVSSWTRVGFVREGTIPGFYKRSDGHLCGCVIDSEASSIEVTDEAQKLAERTINAAKKEARNIPDVIKGATCYEIDAVYGYEFRDEALASNDALHTFDPFGRDAERIFYQVTMKDTSTNVLSAEYQDCFGHALVEMLYAPEEPNEVIAATAGLRALCDDLTARGIVAGFSFIPVDDVETSTAYIAAGFRKTGLLAEGILVRGERKDAILYTRKLANPGEDEPLEG
ncbi:MAG: hypothetical protein GXY23_00380 [Myxococcales bacterium]|jgi:hypothetical protein|nr:hypothetical protein [Myxococcales bacterium]